MIITEEMLKIIRCYPPTGRDFKIMKTIENKSSRYIIELFWCGLIIKIDKFSSEFNHIFNSNARKFCSYKNDITDVFWFLPYRPNKNINMKELIDICFGPLVSCKLALDYLDRFHSMVMDFIENFKTPIEVD